MQPGDLFILEELERSRTFSATAKSLNISHTTVSRKIRELEAHFGARLIERVGERIRMTAEGEAAVASAQAIREEMLCLNRRINDRDNALFGHLVLTTVDILAWHYMAKFADFTRKHPEISLTINTETSVRNLSRRDAEVALRLTNDPEPYLFGKKLDRFHFCHYTAREREQSPTQESPVWLDYSEPNCANRSTDWLLQNMPSIRAKSYFSSPLTMMRAIEDGMGDGLLPKSIADQNTLLVAVDPEPAFSLDVWLLAPKELRHTARVRALISCLSALT